MVTSDLILPCIEPDSTGYIKHENPSVEIIHDAIYIPKIPGIGYEKDLLWGIYNNTGLLSQAGSYRRGEGWGLLGQSIQTEIRPKIYLSDQLYIYAGPCHIHFGHFLLSTLARFWPLITPRSGIKFLMHGDSTPEHWFSFPHFSEIMEGFGLTSSDFVCPTEPLRISELIVPGAAFEELSFAHSTFGHMGTHAGDRLLKHQPMKDLESPIYLSKSKLHSGIWRVRNENAFEAEIFEAGVRVVYPETMSISEQISQLETASTVLGLTGSALHCSLLARRALRIRALAMSESVVRNYRLIDMIKSTDALYFQATNVRQVEPEHNFTAEYEFLDPKAAAREYLSRSLQS